MKPSERAFWGLLSRFWGRWKSSLIIVTLELDSLTAFQRFDVAIIAPFPAGTQQATIRFIIAGEASNELPVEVDLD